MDQFVDAIGLDADQGPLEQDLRAAETLVPTATVVPSDSSYSLSTVEEGGAHLRPSCSASKSRAMSVSFSLMSQAISCAVLPPVSSRAR
jgi:hypothetical protein